MNIYREFEKFVKDYGYKIGERRTYGGLKTIWKIGNRVVIIDEEPYKDNQRIVMVLLEDDERIEYLSPASVFGGALEQFAVGIPPEQVCLPSRLASILEELKRWRRNELE